MPVLLAANIQRSPSRIPVEWYGCVSLIKVVQPLKVLKADEAAAIDIKEAEGYFVFGVWFFEEVLECAPVL